MPRFLLNTVLLLLIDGLSLFAQVAEPGIRIMFYNVENAFDISDDPSTEDNDFLPKGSRRWNKSRYDAKIKSIYKVITATGSWDPPEIIGFCEVENRQILQDIVWGTYLSKYKYKIVHEDSPDRRGIDVCMIYNPEKVHVLEYRYMIPSDQEKFSSRSILYARIAAGYDTLHLFFNHWPSRTGGVLPGNDLRHQLASLIRYKIDSLQIESYGRSKIVVTGDFNSTPDDSEMRILVSGTESRMVNLSSEQAKVGTGTYKYKGVWELLDQVLVSECLKNCRTGLRVDNRSFRISEQDFLLVKDPRYPGMMPFSTYRGYRYQNGFSDHLPVILTLFPAQD